MAKLLITIKKANINNRIILDLKKILALGISDIKTKIDNNIPVIDCQLFENEDDTIKVKGLIKLAENEKIKINVLMQKSMEKEFGEVSTEYLANRIDAYEEGFRKMWEEGLPPE